jgi:hypothetical protein
MHAPNFPSGRRCNLSLIALKPSKRSQVMAIRILSLVIVLSGCTSERLVHDLFVPECNGNGDKPMSRAAACMTAAAYEIAQKKKTSQDETIADKDKETDPRFKEWIP